MDRAIRAGRAFDAVLGTIAQKREQLKRDWRELERMERHLEQARHECALLADAPLIAGGLPPAA